MESISSKDNQRIKKVTKLMKSASYRKESGLFAVEGLRLCRDALKSDAEIAEVYFSESFLDKKADFVDEAAAKAGAAFCLSDRIFSAVSDTKTPQGVLFVIKRLDKTGDFAKIKKNGIILALDTMQDPQNLGTVIRTAEAFGVDSVVMNGSCCDIYSPKVIRGSMGAVFRQSFFITDDLKGFIADFNRFGDTYAAVLDRESVRLNDCDFGRPCLVVIGNEGNGISADIVSVCQKKLFVPMPGGAESLNAAVASGVILWEIIR